MCDGLPGASQSTNQQGGLGDRVYNVEVCLNANHRNMLQCHISMVQGLLPDCVDLMKVHVH